MKILVVDDQQGVLEILTLLLERHGFVVVTAESGEEALPLLEHVSPDVIISDVRMPGMDGWEFFKKVRLHPNAGTAPFIFLTGLSSPPDRVRGLKMGADDFVSKPFDGQELLARIERCIERQRRRADEIPRTKGGISGKLGQLSLIDIIQILELNKRSATIALRHGSETAKIYLKEGLVEGMCLGGEFDSRHFYQLLLWEDAEFAVAEFADEVPPEHRVGLPARELILESARLVDEARQ